MTAWTRTLLKMPRTKRTKMAVGAAVVVHSLRVCLCVVSISEAEIDTSNIITGGRRRAAARIDYSKFADEDDDDDDDE